MKEIQNLTQTRKLSTFPSPPFKFKKVFPHLAILLISLLLAFALSRFWPGQSSFLEKNQRGKEEVISADDLSSQDQVEVGVVYGLVDQVFSDNAEGVLEKGGINGEGTHHLTRPGGDSQSVYLTSSVLDLDLFIGRKVKVEGQTFSAQKAGWLMDVGIVTPLE